LVLNVLTYWIQTTIREGLELQLLTAGAVMEKEVEMTWAEIKKAVEQAGVSEDDEISVIQCENGNGDHTFQKVRLGKALKLAENISREAAQHEAEGCAV